MFSLFLPTLKEVAEFYFQLPSDSLCFFPDLAFTAAWEIQKKKKKKKSKIFYDLRLSDLTPGIVLFAGLWPSIVSVLSLWPDNALFSGVLPDVAFSNVRCDIWGFVI